MDLKEKYEEFKKLLLDANSQYSRAVSYEGISNIFSNPSTSSSKYSFKPPIFKEKLSLTLNETRHSPFGEEIISKTFRTSKPPLNKRHSQKILDSAENSISLLLSEKTTDSDYVQKTNSTTKHEPIVFEEISHYEFKPNKLLPKNDYSDEVQSANDSLFISKDNVDNIAKSSPLHLLPNESYFYPSKKSNIPLTKEIFFPSCNKMTKNASKIFNDLKTSLILNNNSFSNFPLSKATGSDKFLNSNNDQGFLNYENSKKASQNQFFLKSKIYSQNIFHQKLQNASSNSLISKLKAFHSISNSKSTAVLNKNTEYFHNPFKSYRDAISSQKVRSFMNSEKFIKNSDFNKISNFFQDSYLSSDEIYFSNLDKNEYLLDKLLPYSKSSYDNAFEDELPGECRFHIFQIHSSSEELPLKQPPVKNDSTENITKSPSYSLLNPPLPKIIAEDNFLNLSQVPDTTADILIKPKSFEASVKVEISRLKHSNITKLEASSDDAEVTYTVEDTDAIIKRIQKSVENREYFYSPQKQLPYEPTKKIIDETSSASPKIEDIVVDSGKEVLISSNAFFEKLSKPSDDYGQPVVMRSHYETKIKSLKSKQKSDQPDGEKNLEIDEVPKSEILGDIDKTQNHIDSHTSLLDDYTSAPQIPPTISEELVDVRRSIVPQDSSLDVYQLTPTLPPSAPQAYKISLDEKQSYRNIVPQDSSLDVYQLTPTLPASTKMSTTTVGKKVAYENPIDSYKTASLDIFLLIPTLAPSRKTSDPEIGKTLHEKESYKNIVPQDSSLDVYQLTPTLPPLTKMSTITMEKTSVYNKPIDDKSPSLDVLQLTPTLAPSTKVSDEQIEINPTYSSSAKRILKDKPNEYEKLDNKDLAAQSSSLDIYQLTPVLPPSPTTGGVEDSKKKIKTGMGVEEYEEFRKISYPGDSDVPIVSLHPGASKLAKFSSDFKIPATSTIEKLKDLNTGQLITLRSQLYFEQPPKTDWELITFLKSQDHLVQYKDKKRVSIEKEEVALDSKFIKDTDTIQESSPSPAKKSVTSELESSKVSYVDSKDSKIPHELSVGAFELVDEDSPKIDKEPSPTTSEIKLLEYDQNIIYSENLTYSMKTSHKDTVGDIDDTGSSAEFDLKYKVSAETHHVPESKVEPEMIKPSFKKVYEKEKIKESSKLIRDILSKYCKTNYKMYTDDCKEYYTYDRFSYSAYCESDDELLHSPEINKTRDDRSPLELYCESLLNKKYQRKKIQTNKLRDQEKYLHFENEPSSSKGDDYQNKTLFDKKHSKDTKELISSEDESKGNVNGQSYRAAKTYEKSDLCSSLESQGAIRKNFGTRKRSRTQQESENNDYKQSSKHSDDDQDETSVKQIELSSKQSQRKHLKKGSRMREESMDRNIPSTLMESAMGDRNMSQFGDSTDRDSGRSVTFTELPDASQIPDDYQSSNYVRTARSEEQEQPLEARTSPSTSGRQTDGLLRNWSDHLSKTPFDKRHNRNLSTNLRSLWNELQEVNRNFENNRNELLHLLCTYIHGKSDLNCSREIDDSTEEFILDTKNLLDELHRQYQLEKKQALHTFDTVKSGKTEDNLGKLSRVGSVPETYKISNISLESISERIAISSDTLAADCFSDTDQRDSKQSGHPKSLLQKKLEKDMQNLKKLEKDLKFNGLRNIAEDSPTSSSKQRHSIEKSHLKKIRSPHVKFEDLECDLSSLSTLSDSSDFCDSSESISSQSICNNGYGWNDDLSECSSDDKQKISWTTTKHQDEKDKSRLLKGKHSYRVQTCVSWADLRKHENDGRISGFMVDRLNDTVKKQLRKNIAWFCPLPRKGEIEKSHYTKNIIPRTIKKFKAEKECEDGKKIKSNISKSSLQNEDDDEFDPCMSLQDAFHKRKQNFVDQSRRRLQKMSQASQKRREKLQERQNKFSPGNSTTTSICYKYCPRCGILKKETFRETHRCNDRKSFRKPLKFNRF